MQIHIHDVIDNVTRSQSRSISLIDVSPSIFKLERRSKAQNFENANGYLFGIFNFRYNFQYKILSWDQNGGHFENFWILNTISIWLQKWKDRPKLCKNVFSWWWHRRWRHRVASKFSSIFMFRRAWLRASCKRNVSPINVNITIVFLAYTCQKTISMDNVFRDCKSKVNITDLLGDLGT